MPYKKNFFSERFISGFTVIDLISTLKKYKSFNRIEKKVDDEFIDNVQIEFENCQVNRSLLRACKAIDFAFKYGKNVIILGKQGVGKTQLALWFANKYDKINNIDLDENGNKDIYLCICNEILKCSDLIGRQKPSDNFNTVIHDTIRFHFYNVNITKIQKSDNY